MVLLIGRVDLNGESVFISPDANDSEKFECLDGNFENGFRGTGRYISAKDVRFKIPFEPGKLIGIGKNYPSIDEPEEKHISFFLMANNALLPHRESLVLSKRIGSLIPEGELAVVIGKVLKNASLQDAENGILGYTICNDFSARDTTPPESNAAIRKSSDGLLPTGPYILLDNSLRDFDIKTYCNGNLVQQGNTNQMLHKIPDLISYISDFMTLYPFDIISTGTPGPKLKVERGNVIRVEVEDIGTLENKIV
ncbi:hypothetical protein A0128_07340 [Leptospira tipperaryensis]|uniref:Fumarylacetoacetase-like C-terminal domain-containing protein n=1 Tax=Leptospira tipperaryensis TaxID=2564040 RepID=A0A1D7UVP8_9LEPT|nr:fumarylacetoacetate hydrolase family protein [Leptospira tipperaryensis]AOP33670.1 hypothetical protein A0128_07340 [Leptospira tipperaryensis]